MTEHMTVAKKTVTLLGEDELEVLEGALHTASGIYRRRIQPGNDLIAVNSIELAASLIDQFQHDLQAALSGRPAKGPVTIKCGDGDSVELSWDDTPTSMGSLIMQALFLAHRETGCGHKPTALLIDRLL